MRTLQFIKEPGYMYDLFTLFHMYFDQKSQRNDGTEREKNPDRAYADQLLEEFGEAPAELFVFFGKLSEEKRFLETYYFAAWKKQFISGQYDLEAVLKALSEEKKVLYQLTEFYFGHTDEAILTDGINLCMVNQWIRESAYREELKNALYSFYIDPAAMLQSLIRELQQKSQWLSARYEAQKEQLKRLEKEFDYEYLLDSLLQCQKHKFDIAGYEKVYVSFCLCARNVLGYYLCPDAITYLVGINSRDALEKLLQERKAPDLVTLGNAISEQNRIDILNLIYNRKEMTIKEVESALGFTTANAYYHLAILCKAGLLKTRNPGRTVFYSVNEKYFSALCEVFGRYAK